MLTSLFSLAETEDGCLDLGIVDFLDRSITDALYQGRKKNTL